MKTTLLILIIILFASVQASFAQDVLCLPCSQNLGTGFTIEEVNPSKGIQLVSSAVGIIASAKQTAPDGSALISGYMPVCVVPMVVAGNRIDTCHGNTIDLYAQSYLYEEIVWESPDGTKTIRTPQGGLGVEQPLSVTLKNKTPNPLTTTMKVSSKKGGIYSDTNGSVTYTVYPKPVLNFKQKSDYFCRESYIRIIALDSIFPDSGLLSWTWTANGESGKIGNGNAQGKELSLIPIAGMTSLEVSLNIQNKYTSIVSCAVLNTTFILKSINPEANTQISHDGATQINPADFETKKLKFSLRSEDKTDFIRALEACPPESVEADFIYDTDLFIPINTDNWTIIPNTSTGKSTLKYKGTPKVSKTEPLLFELEGYPTLGSKTKARYEVSNIQFSASTISSGSYRINNPDIIELDYSICRENANDRFLYKSQTESIMIYPNPSNGNHITLSFIEGNKSDLSNAVVNVDIYSTMGIKVFSQIFFVNQDNIIELPLPSFLLNGLYRVTVRANDKEMDALLTLLK